MVSLAQYEQQYHTMLPNYSWFEDIMPSKTGALVVGEANGKAVILHLDSSGKAVWRDSSLNLPLSHGLRLIQNSKGKVHMLGDFEATNGVNDIYCRQYSAYRKLQWQSTYDSPNGSFNPDHFSDAVIDHNDNLYIAGSGKAGGSSDKAQILKYNANGSLLTDTLLSKRHGTGKYVGIEVDSNRVLATFYSQFGATLTTELHCFDLDLNLLWESDLPYTFIFNHNALAINPSGYAAVVGRKYSNLKDALIIYRPNGDTVRNIQMDLPGYSVLYNSKVIMDTTKFIYVLANYNSVQMLSKYDTTGYFYWADTLSRRLIGVVENSQVFHLAGDRIICSSFYLNAQLHIFDTAGTRLYQIPIDLPGYTTPKIASITTDRQGGILICGAAADGNKPSSKHAFATYFKNLNPIDTSDTTITSRWMSHNDFDQIGLFPNPVHNQLNFEKEHTFITIYNSQGQMVRYFPKPTRQLHLASLPGGLYTIVATDKKGSLHKASFVKL